jgi:hypothetical protein
MNKICMFCVYTAITITLAGCGAATIKPNYTSAQPELMRIGGETPEAKAPEILNLGSYCLQVTEEWKVDGETPDGQMIWTKNSIRKVIPCQ